MAWTDELIQGKILHKLFRFGKVKASHTAIENTYKYFPKHMRNRAKENIDLLIKRGLLIKKITNYGVHISINLNRGTSQEISRLIRKFKKSLVLFI